MTLNRLDLNTHSLNKEIRDCIEWWQALNLKGKKRVKLMYFEEDKSLVSNIINGYRLTLECLEKAA
jgi:hypothetical protein